MPPVEQPRFRFPSAFTILFGLIILVAVLTWIIPAGQYARVPSQALGQDVPVAGSYAPTGANPQGLSGILMAPITGFYDPVTYTANAISVALFVLVIGGFIGVVTATGAIDAGIIARLGEGKLVESFVAGARDLLGVALIIGLGRGIVVVMDAGLITRTSSVVMRGLAIGRVPYERWLRVVWPLPVVLSVIIMAALALAAYLEATA